MPEYPLITQANHADLAGRIPYRLKVLEDSTVLFKWIFIGEKRFSEPFFEESIMACMSLPQNSSMPYTTGKTVIEFASFQESISPCAFIYHVSRCGSTLLTQMLCSDERIVALSEVPLLDAILRLPFSHPGKNFDRLEELFKSVVRILAKKKSGNEKYLFIKTDSWHLYFQEAIKNMFPDVPSILLYRNPSEVIRSQNKRKGMHAVKDVLEPALFGWSDAQLEDLSPEEYLEKIMACYFEKVIEILQLDQQVVPIDYKNGVLEMLHITLSSCGIDIESPQLQKMQSRAERHSKNPEITFAEVCDLPEPYYFIDLDTIYGKLKSIETKRNIGIPHSTIK